METIVARAVREIAEHPLIFIAVSLAVVFALVWALDWFIGRAERDDRVEAARAEVFYPVGWPSCSCGRPVLDGHITCGRLECGTQASNVARVPLTDDDLVSLERALNHHQHRHVAGDARR